MGKTVQTIAKNATILMTSQLITWGLALILTVALPRYLGPTVSGKYQLAASLLAIIGIIANYGMETYLTKEIARAPERLNQLFGTAVVMRLILYLIGYVILAGYVRMVGYSVDTLYIVAILAVAFYIDQLATLCQACLQGLERMEFISLSSVVTKIFTVAATLVLLALKQDILAITAVNVGAAVISFGILFAALIRTGKLSLSVDWLLAKEMMKASFPYMLTGVLLILYQRIDILILSLLIDEQAIGWYSAATTLIATTLFIPTIFMMAVFPAMARMFKTDQDHGPKVVRKSFDLLMLVGIPIGMGMMVIADPLVVMLYGPEFKGSGPVLAVRGIVVIFTYLNILLGKYMISIDKQTVWTVIMAVGTAATIPLDFILVPWCQSTFGNGAIGGSLSFLFTELFMVIAGLVMIPKKTITGENYLTLLKIVIGGSAMTAVVWFLPNVFLGFRILIGAAVYATMILLLRIIPNEDWVLIRELSNQVIGRLRRGKISPAVAKGQN